MSELTGVDLSAWQAPEPPDDLADGVVARLRGTAVSVALPVEPVAPRRRWLAIGGIAAALAAAAATWAIVRSPALPDDGAVRAARARRLELPGATAMLDPGADLRWRRDGGTIRIDQRAGGATWTVGDRTLLIDAAGASLEATGASLRVEVSMNMSDARLIGVSAMTSAAVALGTVVVYEGHVRATQAGRTVIVEPGTTLQLGEAAPVAVGAGPVAATAGDLRSECSTDRTEHRWSDLQDCARRMAAFSAEEASRFAQIAHDEQAAESELGKLSEAVKGGKLAAAHASLVKIPAASVYYVHASQAYADLERHVADRWRDLARALASAHECDKLQEMANVADLELAEGGDAMRAVPCGAATPTVACDPLEEMRRGSIAYETGKYHEALDHFDAWYRCNRDVSAARLAFLAACGQSALVEARRWWRVLGEADRNRLITRCVANKITQAQLEASAELRIASTPAAEVVLDGVDTGRMTPASLDVAPGRHQLTLVDGDHRHQYSVEVEEGVTIMSKQLH